MVFWHIMLGLSAVLIGAIYTVVVLNRRPYVREIVLPRNYWIPSPINNTTVYPINNGRALPRNNSGDLPSNNSGNLHTPSKTGYIAPPGELCAICMDEIPNTEMQHLRCGHGLHKNCLLYLRAHRCDSCPMCRSPL